MKIWVKGGAYAVIIRRFKSIQDREERMIVDDDTIFK